MNRIITILGFSIAIPAFLSIFVNDKHVLAIVTIVAFAVCCLLFWIESILRTKGSVVLGFIAYFFHKTRRGCIIEEQRLVYERIDKFNWEFTKKYRIKSKSNVLDHFDDRFCWSNDSSKAIIKPCENAQKIDGIQSEEIWTIYSVQFNSVPRGHTIDTGAHITNLIDADLSARPFLSTTIIPKTKLLRMTVKIPQEFAPKNPRLVIYTSSSLDSRINSMPLSYNEVSHEIDVPPVRFPRTNWRYVILWDP